MGYIRTRARVCYVYLDEHSQKKMLLVPIIYKQTNKQTLF